MHIFNTPTFAAVSIVRKLFISLAGVLVATVMVGSAASSVARDTVDLSIGPVAVNTQAVNIALALSVEWPTVGAAYRGDAYDHASAYLGYFDPKACYFYKDISAGAPLAGEYFYRTGNVDASNFCNSAAAGTGYSGNLLNYVSTSTIDLLRYALTGGNRIVDNASVTVLDRAYLYNSWGLHNSNFPVKSIPAVMVGKVTPNLGSPANDAIFAGSCLDRVWFGTNNLGANCDNPGTSGNLNALVPDLSSTTFVVVNTGAPAPANSIAGPVPVYEISSPRRITTIAPTEGPISFVDVTVLGSDTSTTAPPNVSTSVSLITTTYVAKTGGGSTSTTAPPAQMPQVIVSSTTTLSNPRVFRSQLPTSGAYRVISGVSNSNTTRVCSSGSNFIGALDALGALTGVASGSCGKSPYTGFSSRVQINTIAGLPSTFNMYEPLNTVNVYQLYDPVNVYKSHTIRRDYSEYDLKDQYTVIGARRGIMYARVKVCDDSEKTTRTDLCVRYPNGNYKPVGEIQKKSQGVRVAAFGYLKDDSTTRYGGVLRAPMKYTGPDYKDSEGVKQTNANSEWNLNSGIFVTDPLNASPTYVSSGVINYLNKFGTTGTTKGYYKGIDPVGELYYEALRYFQGLDPTADATALSSGQTVAGLADGFPYYSNTGSWPKWQDPIQNGCERRNYILTIGDVNTHRDRYLPGLVSGMVTTDDPFPRPAEPLKGDSSKTFNAVTWTDILTGFETNVSKSYTDALGRAQTTTGNPNPVSSNTNLATKGTGSNNSAYFWAGAAYWANTQPIRWDIDSKGQSLKNVRIKTFTIDADEGGDGKMDGNKRGIQPRNSSFYLAGKYGWFNDSNFDGNPFKSAGGITDNREWQDTETANTPEGYVIASQAQKMINGIRKFFGSATNDKGAITVSSLSSQRFDRQAPDGFLYSPRFSVSDWSGSVQKTRLSLNSVTGVVEAQATIIWDAGTILTTASVNTGTVADPYVKPADRKIFTMARTAANEGGQAFTVANKASLDASTALALNTNPSTNVVDSNIDARINWIRGDRSNEVNGTGGFLRTRNSIMGDVINSGPVYKGAANINRVGAGYGSFASSVLEREAVIYVGANDGMLHALRANDGKELFAYIPNAVSTTLNTLTHPNYRHQPYVDAVPTIDEVKIGANWKTLLASGMGGGAQGIFALDVTDPTNFDAANVLFEFTDQDDRDMGNVVSAPVFVQLKIPAAGATLATTAWFLAVTSGYNNYKTDSFVTSGTGQQALFLLRMDKARGTAWQENTNYFKVMTDVTVGSGVNGLANPTTVEDNLTGITKILYSGDLQGNVWKFDFTDGITQSLALESNRVNGVRKPLFTATDAAGKAQPITISPLAFAATNKGYVVVFGTGKFMEPTDSSTADIQTMYGVWDSLETSTANYTVPKSSLFVRTAVEAASSIVISSTTFNFGMNTGEHRGWYFNLPTVRERIAVEGKGDTGLIAINSTIPDGTCNGDGSGNRYALNPITGIGKASAEREKGFLSSPNIIEIDLNQVTSQSTSGWRRRTFQRQVITTTTQIADAGNVVTVGTERDSSLDISYPEGIINWREIRNPQLR